ncbi:MAG: uroporphyrinogen-III C-methyltransferase [Ethanoligenens sp.]
MPTGKVILVGAGPGDPDLLTVKGARALAEADVVVYDRLVSPAILARIPAHAERIDVGKESGSHPVPQQRIQEILRDKALEGNLVVRLKGGDPFLFGRGGEELAFLAMNGIPFSEVPGIPSAIAAPAYAGIPVTNRGEARSLHIFTGHAKDNESPKIDFESAAKLGGTLVFLMGVSTMEHICAGLLAAGLAPATPAAIVENGTLPVQRRISSRLADISADARAQAVRSPSILVVGEVCSQAQTLDWFSRLPLFGRRIVLTMPEDTVQPLAERLRALGADVLSYPCIQTISLPDDSALRTAIHRLYAYRFLVFTSRRGVDAFFQTLRNMALDARALAGCQVAAIAQHTAARLLECGIRPDLVPEQADGTHLAQAILQAAKPGDRILLCRSAQATQTLPDRLHAGGLEVDDLPAYETRALPGEASDAAFADHPPDAVVFTSGSAVDAFLHRSGMHPTSIQGICIGETTAARARAHGIRCTVADHPDPNALIDTICEVTKHGTF